MVGCNLLAFSARSISDGRGGNGSRNDWNVLALTFSKPIALVCATVHAGCSHGLGQLAVLTLIGLHPGDDRAEANDVLNIGDYIPAGLIPVATGFVIDKAGPTAATLFAIILSAIAIAGA